MLERALLVTLLAWFCGLHQAMAEEVSPTTATEQESAASAPAAPPAAASAPEASSPPAAASAPEASSPPAAVSAPEASSPPAPPAATAAPKGNLPAGGTAEVPSENVEQEMEQRIRAYRELYDARKVETLRHLEEARRRYEARERAYVDKVEAYLKQREERLERLAKQYDEQRRSIASERDYLVDHSKELLQMAVDQKDAMIKRQEDLRNETEQRKARVAGFLSTMEDMTPQERHNYINQHYSEMFDRSNEVQAPYSGASQFGAPMGGPQSSYVENPYYRLPAAPQ
jgi:hypothetical protein